MTKPTIVDRPVMPTGYGVESAVTYLSWDDVETRLRDSKHYWLSTTRADGRPHVVPRWGIWLDDVFWYDGSPETVHVRNLAGNPFCTLNLEDGGKAVIIEGVSVVSQPVVGELGERIAAEYARKYGAEYSPEPDSWSDETAGGLRILKPSKALAWTEFPKDLTRFTF